MDLQSALGPPMELAARAAWARELARTDPVGTPSQIARGQVPILDPRRPQAAGSEAAASLGGATGRGRGREQQQQQQEEEEEAEAGRGRRRREAPDVFDEFSGESLRGGGGRRRSDPAARAARSAARGGVYGVYGGGGGPHTPDGGYLSSSEGEGEEEEAAPAMGERYWQQE